jgi:regulator of sirC expression with transglutaminase-like and TPR domain
MTVPAFRELAASAEPPLDELALALAAEFRDVDAAATLAELDRLGAELAAEGADSPEEQLEACRVVLGERHGFVGNSDEYDHPGNSMLDLVVERRTGLPITLSVVYVEVARRAGIELAGVGLPGHYVAGHFGADPPLLLDPFGGGLPFEADVTPHLVRPWGAHETVLRMLNNLVASYDARADLGRALHAARLRLVLPLTGDLRDGLETELRTLEARLN